MSNTGRNLVSAEMLRGFVERVETIDAQKGDLDADRAVIMAEAKQKGFVPKAINHVVKLRRMKPSERQEAEALRDSYLHALGETVDLPLFRMVGLINVDLTMRDNVIEAMKRFVPLGGAITIEAGAKPIRLSRDAEGRITVTEIVEKPHSFEAPEDKKPGAPKPDVPDVDADGAEALGRQAFRDDVPIIKNPFPFGDPRRPRWDKGWRDESGTDGMGPG
jgi:uncharacterized protein (UPF0335 family)